MPIVVNRVVRWLIQPFKIQPIGRVPGVPPRWRRRTSTFLGVGAAGLAMFAIFYGVAGEVRAFAFLGGAAIGFWLGTQELLTP